MNTVLAHSQGYAQARHVHSRQSEITAHAKVLIEESSYAREELAWFWRFYEDKIMPIRGPIRIMGLIGLGSLEEAFHAGPVGETFASEWSQFILFCKRKDAWINHLITTNHADKSHYAFASDPAIRSSDIQLLQSKNIATFPHPFVLGQLGDVHRTDASKWIPAGMAVDRIPTVFLQPSCPPSIRNQPELSHLTCLDIAGCDKKAVLDLLLGAALRKKLHNLILLEEDLMTSRMVQCIRSSFDQKHAALLFRVLASASKHHGHPTHPKTVKPEHEGHFRNYFFVDRCRTRCAMWWPDTDKLEALYRTF